MGETAIVRSFFCMTISYVPWVISDRECSIWDSQIILSMTWKSQIIALLLEVIQKILSAENIADVGNQKRENIILVSTNILKKLLKF